MPCLSSDALVGIVGRHTIVITVHTGELLFEQLWVRVAHVRSYKLGTLAS